MLACSCGLESPEKCKALFETIIAKEFSDYRYARVHRLTVDTYSLQHPDPYMISAKSFAAHLTGICCVMKHGNDRQLLKTLQRWLNGKRELQKPALLEHVGGLTISHVENASDEVEHQKLVQEWAADVWQAYATYHDLAERWIEMARKAVTSEGKI